MLGKGYGGLYKAPTKEERRKQKAKRREIRSNLLILDLNDGKLQDSGKQEEGKTLHRLHVSGWMVICGIVLIRVCQLVRVCNCFNKGMSTGKGM